MAGIIELLAIARRQPPANPAIYELLADTWVHSSTKITRDDALALVQGASQFPTRLKLVYQAAAFCAEIDVLDAAHSLTDHGIKYASNEETKTRFEKLKAALPPLTALPEAAR
jgi:hypothetical protein